MKEFEISKVLNLAKGNKYAIACASFDLVDHIFKVEVPKNMRTRKLSVQAMSLLHEGSVKYGYEPRTPESGMNSPVKIEDKSSEE
ncbi:MAG: hypothetical protein OEV66_07240 [Spirochaetia bacterium]|nr:hypothetical protein [Spirochaetia bacterium]